MKPCSLSSLFLLLASVLLYSSKKGKCIGAIQSKRHNPTGGIISLDTTVIEGQMFQLLNI